MGISSDFAINLATKRISHVSGTTVYSANAFYSWLSTVFSALSYLTHDVPMSAETPFNYTFNYGWEMENDTDYNFINGGAITVNRGGSNDLWSNVYTIASFYGPTNVLVKQNGVELAPWWGQGSIDILIKVMSNGVLIDNGNVTFIAAELGTLNDYNSVNLAGGGRNPVSLSTFEDINNTTSAAVLGAAPYTNITFTFADITYDIVNGAGPKPYACTIDCAGLTLAQVYEYTKYRTASNSSFIINGIEGKFYTVAKPGFNPSKQAKFGTFAGGKFFGAQGVLLVNFDTASPFQLTDSNGSPQIPPTYTKVSVISLSSGDAVTVAETKSPTYSLVSTTASSITVSGTISEDSPVAGSFTVSNNGNNYTYAYRSFSGSVFHGVSPDPSSSPALEAGDIVTLTYIKKNSNTFASATSNSITVNTSIPTDMPKEGFIRGVHEGLEYLFTYTDWSNKTYTGVSPDPTLTPLAASDNMFFPVIDAYAGPSGILSNSYIYNADKNYRVLVRRHGIYPFQIDVTVTSSGLSQPAIRTTDTITT